MQELTAEGQRIVDDVARRHGVSSDAVRTLLEAVARGQGNQAQFNHSELGGMGQWSKGGMIMIGDMFNNNLKYRVDSLCNELSNLWFSSGAQAFGGPSQTQWQSGNGPQPFDTQGSNLFVPAAGGNTGGNWWPSDLGWPSSSGAQNDMRYAVFPQARRLAVQTNGQVSIYDTGDHQIGGVSQQQGGPGQTVTFSSQFGTFSSLNLPLVSGPGGSTPAPTYANGSSSTANLAPAAGDNHNEIFAKIEKLAELHQRGLLSDNEFASKKQELLNRI